ncbi:MAG TPA: HAMP domain-containing sensor histidine kinase [bacterium]|nr:HAMP domain-containing sensor histidine kinase [bacterium]
MIRRPWIIMSVFGLCLAVSFIAIGLVSAVALRLENERERAAQEAAQGESIRLALWRMDSALSTFIAAESARLYYAYDPFYTLAETSLPQEAYALVDADRRFPSPLKGRDFDHIRIHFQLGPGGELSSPQAATGNNPSGPVAINGNHRDQSASVLLDKLGRIVNRDSLLQALNQENARIPVSSPPLIASRKNVPRSQLSQSAMSEREFQDRAVQNVVVNTQMIEAGQADLAGLVNDPETNLMRPVWIKGELFLARVVDRGNGRSIQGCWLDWPGISKWLLAEIEDLLPGAELVPATDRDDSDPGRMLAALPVKLEPGPLPQGLVRQDSAVNLVLALAWISAIIAAIAVGALLLAAVSLSERRAAFVSAVTHELRTPLTTLRMYTEMLAEGMVPDEEKRHSYIESLRAESERLGHLVENVLSYSRLEKGNARAAVQVVSVEELVERVMGPLTDRARQAGMNIELDAGRDALTANVRADAPAVERILFNLVDNACKYASRGTDRTIRLELARGDKFVVLRVRDQGPGISRKDARRLFRPFSKSAQAAANSAPGVGLGLSLSQKLARNMGGDLRLESNTAQGACFALSLIVARA